jgi:prefoldin subunit 5
LDELNGTIQKYKKELQSIQLKKVTFKEINKTCVQVKQIIKEFKEKREHLFHQCEPQPSCDFRWL